MTEQLKELFLNNNGRLFMRCTTNDNGDFTNYEVSEKLFSNKWTKIDYKRISAVTIEQYITCADGYYISYIYY